MIFPSVEQADRAKSRNRDNKNRKALTATVGAQEAMSASLDDQAALLTRCSRMRTAISVQKTRIALGQSVLIQQANEHQQTMLQQLRHWVTSGLTESSVMLYAATCLDSSPCFVLRV